MGIKLETETDGENGFVGMASRENPIAIEPGYVQYAQNMRFDRGVASVRKGTQRLMSGEFEGQTVFASGVYSEPVNGQEKIVLIGGTAIYIFAVATGEFTSVNYPVGQTVIATDVPDVIQANNSFYILRGQTSGKSPLVWNGAGTITVAPSSVLSGTEANFPPSEFGVYFQNRIIIKRDRDEIACSDILDFDKWDLTFNQFKINLGANDNIIGFLPWQEDKFVLFQRNSIYYAFIDPNGYAAGAGPGGGSYVKSLTFDFGCAARRSIVNAGDHIFFLSDSGVHVLTPSLDLKLLGNQLPLSEPIADIISRINTAFVGGAVARVHNNRYYLAVPLDGATRNNVVLIYSMLTKAWESIDTFPDGMFIDNFLVAAAGASKRLFCTNAEGGIYKMEERDWDEFEVAGGNPIIPFTLPSTISTSFTQHSAAGKLLSRRYNFKTFNAKRFSSAQVDFSMRLGDHVKTTVVITNPDTSLLVDEFGAAADEDFTRRFRVGSRGYGVDVQIESVTGRPTIRGLRVDASQLGRKLVSEE